MEIKITTLSENTAAPGGLAEWGLSMLVEADGQKILFDTGGGIAAVHNAELMKIDLAAVDRMVLSHGHYDHTGGLLEVLRRAGRKVWRRPALSRVICANWVHKKNYCIGKLLGV